MTVELERLISDVAAALVGIDRCGVPFKQFQCGVGPYGEPQLLAAVAQHLNTLPKYEGAVKTKELRICSFETNGLWSSNL
jgi:hypothetical protein